TSRLFFLFPGANDQTEAQERIVGSAMGLSVDQSVLWVSNKEQVWRFSNVGPRRIEDNDWQAVYMPRKGYFLGGCDTHDIVAGASFGDTRYELAFVNTLYSCVAAIDAHYGFRPLWKPDFITALSPEDRCHLNGVGSRDGELAYVTLCGRSDTPLGWKEVKNGGGMVIDIRSDEVLCQGLSMPHSPRWHNDRLWLLNSGDGDFGFLDGGAFVPVALCAGFARGLTFVGDYAVIALSRLRDNIFASGITIKDRLEKLRIPQRCGLIVVDLNTGGVVHWLTIDGVVTELYDVAFLPGITRPYTPGFSEPDLHRRIQHVMPDIFPLAPPRPGPDQDGASTPVRNGAKP
ncbi:MAG: TIGR03032 family protein, partial [Alphaproteobacteria bacterium]|nr:TIGR03032 family protein [Alphaproteobacteria bacterium]